MKRMREPMCYDPDSLPSAEDTARELRQMKRLSAVLCVVSAALVVVSLMFLWRAIK